MRGFAPEADATVSMSSRVAASAACWSASDYCLIFDIDLFNSSACGPAIRGGGVRSSRKGFALHGIACIVAACKLAGVPVPDPAVRVA